MATQRGSIDRRRFVIGAGALAGGLRALGGRVDAKGSPTTAPHPTIARHARQSDEPKTFASQIDTANIAPGGVIIEGGIGEVRLLNTILSGDSTTARALSLIHDGLVLIDPDSTLPVPNLADSWEVSADGLTYTFALKQGISFHDGQPLTAQDVKFTYESAMIPETTSVRAGILNQRIAAITAPDDATVIFQMKGVVAPFLTQNASYGILPRHLLADLAPADWPSAAFNAHPIGTGAFKFKELRAGEALELEKNPDYHRGAPALDGWIYKVVPDTTVLYQQLKTGEVDYTQIQPDFVEDAQQQTNFVTVVFDAFATSTYQINMDPERTPIFQEVEVRQAMAYAIDRPSIVEAIRLGLAVVAVGIFPTISWAYQPESVPPELRYDFDPERAMQLLDEAGWVPGSDGIREKGGQRLAFEMTGRAGSKVVEGYLAVFQENWKAVGIEMTPLFLEGSVLDQVLDVTYDFDVVNTGFGWSADPDQTILWHSQSYKAGFNNMKYANPRVDELLDQALQTLDVEQRKGLYAEMQNLILADMPAFVMDFVKMIWGVNTRVKNLIPNAVTIAFNPHQWYVTDGN